MPAYMCPDCDVPLIDFLCPKCKQAFALKNGRLFPREDPADDFDEDDDDEDDAFKQIDDDIQDLEMLDFFGEDM